MSITLLEAKRQEKVAHDAAEKAAHRMRLAHLQRMRDLVLPELEAIVTSELRVPSTGGGTPKRLSELSDGSHPLRRLTDLRYPPPTSVQNGLVCEIFRLDLYYRKQLTLGVCWTSSTPEFRQPHYCVAFRDDGDRHSQVERFYDGVEALARLCEHLAALEVRDRNAA